MWGVSKQTTIWLHSLATNSSYYYVHVSLMMSLCQLLRTQVVSLCVQMATSAENTGPLVNTWTGSKQTNKQTNKQTSEQTNKQKNL